MATKPVLILMAGLPGTGKSTLAAALGRELHWPVLDKDNLKSRLINMGLGISEDELGKIVYEASFVQSEDLLVDQHLSIIFDTAALYTSILEEIIRIVHAAEANMKTILCSAPKELRRQRLEERAASNLYYPFRIPMKTADIENDLEYFTHLPSDKLIIDTQIPLEICLDKALTYLLSI